MSRYFNAHERTKASALRYLHAHWEEIPARYPVHFDAAGVANRWANRTPIAIDAP